MMKILFLAANPRDTDRLRLDEEVRAIDEALRKADFRDHFVLHSHWAVRIDDLQELLLRYQPHIVHFSGHGKGTRSMSQRTSPRPDSARADRNLEPVPEEGEDRRHPSGQIVLQDASGKSAPVPPEALSNLFRVLKDNIRCVVLNACYTQAQAEGIAQHIDCVVGMSDAIPDATAIAFAAAFYRGLGYGRSIGLAFDLGCSQIDLNALRGSAIPQLIALRTEANRLVLATDGVDAEPQADGEPAPGESPYKGLQYFDTADAARFFGREALTAELVAYLRTHRFLAVVGASGSGKSSVIRAGLMPALARGEPLLDGTLPPEGSAQWPVHIITPKAHPLKELAATLTRDDASHLAQAKLMDELAQDARVLDLCVARLLSGKSAKRLLLVVDQFEELFTLCSDQTERKAFVDNLLTAAVDDGVTTVAITLRADFYAHCAQFDNLRTALESRQKYIGPMNRDELRRAIEEPAKQEGWEFEPGLVDLLLHDVGDEPGALPLLSHALLETWKRRRGHTMTLAGYVESGRVQGAIAQTAERVFTQQLTPEQQPIAKSIFLRLTELGEGAEDTRRRVQLVELMPQAEDKATIETVLTALADARLVTTDKDEVEVAHEALIREWPALRRWLDENREGLRIHRRLTEDAQGWHELGRDAAALYGGVRLQQALTWQHESDPTLTELEATFLCAGKRRHNWIRLRNAAVVLSVFIVMGWLSWQQVVQIRANNAWAAAVESKANCNVSEARQNFDTAVRLDGKYSSLRDDEILNMVIACATVWVQAGESLLREAQKTDDSVLQQTAYLSATTLFAQSAALNPPPDVPIYIKIPAGEFIMGAGEGDEQRANEVGYDISDEQPITTIYLDEFWIQRTEVTNEQYLRYLEESCEKDANAEDCVNAPNNANYAKPAWLKRPVTGVDWFKASDYAKWVGGRLPTEAEWEKACRGGLEIPIEPLDAQSALVKNPLPNRTYPWGDEPPSHERLNYNYDIGNMTDVGNYSDGTSPYGLYDMAGNVWERTSSKYQDYPYDPTDGREDLEGNAARTLRGGSWIDGEDNVRCAYRDFFRQNLIADDSFRVVVLSPGFVRETGALRQR